MEIPQYILKCKDFDEVLNKGYFQDLSENMQINVYNHFEKIERKKEEFTPYIDLDWGNFDNFSVKVEGLETTVGELLSEGFVVRACKEKRGPIRGISAWLDEGEWNYLGLIYVSPDFRQKGIMGGLIDDGDNGKPIFTKVHKNNQLALSSFKKYGFVEERRNEDFFELSRGLASH